MTKPIKNTISQKKNLRVCAAAAVILAMMAVLPRQVVRHATHDNKINNTMAIRHRMDYRPIFLSKRASERCKI